MKLVSLPDYPIPDGVIVSSIRAADGVELRFARWPGPFDARGTVVLLQGRAEFIEKYFEVIGELISRGFGVVTFDWRGQGLSDRLLPDKRKGYIEDFAQYDLDFHSIFEQVVQPGCRPPYLGLAHSTGAAMLLRAVARRSVPIDSLILTSPMIGLPFLSESGLARIALRLLVSAGFGTRYVPGGHDDIMDLRPFAGNKRTSDQGRYERCARLVAAQPDLGLGSPTIGWTAAAAEATHEFADPDFPRRILARSLVIAPGRDQIVSPAASRAFSERSNSIKYVMVANSKHELLMEHDEFRSQFWAAFDSFWT